MLKLALGLVALNVFGLFNNVNPIFNIETDDSVVTKYYNINSIPTPQDSKLGIGELVEEQESNLRNAGKKDSSGNDIYYSYNVNRLFKYPNVACSIIEDLDSEFHDMNPGSSVSISYTTTTSEEITYNKQISEILENTFGVSVSISTGIGILKSEGSTNLGLTYGFSETKGISNTYSKSQSTSLTYTYSVDSKGLYRLTRRGLFDVYVIQKLVGINDVSYYSKDNILYASSKFKYYTLSSYSYVLSYVNNSMYEGLTKYIENGDSTYSVDQDYVLSLFPSSNVVCID